MGANFISLLVKLVVPPAQLSIPLAEAWRVVFAFYLFVFSFLFCNQKNVRSCGKESDLSHM
jgi:hypothetical protein